MKTTRATEAPPPGSPPARRLVSTYLAIFSLAFVVRGLYLLELAPTALFAVLLGDGRHYYAWALEIAGGEWLGREAFYQAPLYPYSIAVLIRIFGPELWPIRVLQIAMGSASCLLVAVAGHRFFSYRVGLFAGLLLAFYPPAIFFDGLIQKTSFSLFFTSALLALVGELTHRMRWQWLFLSGVALGLLSLTRENALILVPVVGAWIFVSFKDVARLKRAKRVGLFGVGLAVVLGSVGVRNFVVSGQFLLTTSQLGSNFFIGNNAGADGRYQPLQPGREDARVERQDAIDLAEADLGRSLTPGEVSRYWLARAWSYIRLEPGGWARLLLRKTSLLVNPREIVDTESIEAYRDESRLLRVVSWLLHWGIVGPLAVLGLWATRARWRYLWILYAIELSLASSLILFYVMARYRFPMVPVAVLFAGAGIDELYQCLAMRSKRRKRVLLNVLLLGFVGLVQSRPLPIETHPRATTYFNLGVSLYEKGDLEQAQGALEKTLRILPNFADGHFSLGNVLAASGQPSEAMAHYREALAIDGRHVEAHVRLAHLLTNEGQRDEAIRHYQAALEWEPDDAATHVSLAYLLIQKGDVAEAREHLERAIAVAPEHAMAHNLLANILAHQGRQQEAVDHYEAALAIEPRLADAHFKLGVVFTERGRFEPALRHLEETIRLVPDFAEAHLQLAVVLERLGRMDEAADASRRAQELGRN